VGSRNDIRSMTAQGDDDRLLAQDAILPVLSPDGSRLLYTALGDTLTQRILELSTGKVRDVGDLGPLPAWSPDSQSIAYSPPGSTSIVRLELQDGSQTALTIPAAGSPGWNVHPEWSADGKRIVFSSERLSTAASNGQVWLNVMDADGGNRRPIIRQDDSSCLGTNWPASTAPLAWSPDPGGTGSGQLIAYGKFCGDAITLGLVTADGKEIRGRSYELPGATQISWSPDGRRVLVTALDSASGMSILYSADADGAHLVRLAANASDAAWSPDPGGTGSGKQIAYVINDSAGLQHIDTVNADGSGLAQITSNPGAGKVCLH